MYINKTLNKHCEGIFWNITVLLVNNLFLHPRLSEKAEAILEIESTFRKGNWDNTKKKELYMFISLVAMLQKNPSNFFNG